MNPAHKCLLILLAAAVLGLAGLPVVELGEGAMLVTVTEKRTRDEIDRYVKIAAEICRGGSE